LSDFIGIVGLIIGIIGLAYALYQGTERSKLETFVRSQAWYLFSKANNTTGIIQHALKMYKDLHKDQLNYELLEVIAKSDAFGQDLFKETIRQIQLAEPCFDQAVIQKWINEGKLNEDFRQLFMQLAIEQDKEGHLLYFIKKILKRR
jgi:hypothetical protein